MKKRLNQKYLRRSFWKGEELKRGENRSRYKRSRMVRN